MGAALQLINIALKLQFHKILKNHYLLQKFITYIFTYRTMIRRSIDSIGETQYNEINDDHKDVRQGITG